MRPNYKGYTIKWNGFEAIYVPKALPMKYDGFEMTFKSRITGKWIKISDL